MRGVRCIKYVRYEETFTFPNGSRFRSREKDHELVENIIRKSVDMIQYMVF
jgi:hypothetical protein